MNNYAEKEYRLLGDIAPRSYLIKTGAKGDLLIFDEAKGFQRPIRHCRNEKSVFIDEQSEHALVDPVIIEFGYIKVPAHEQATQKFLDIHPSNKSNGGSLFEEIDDEQLAEESLEYEDLVIDLKALVRAKQKEEDGLYELQTLAASIKASYAKVKDLSMSELRQIIYRAIDENAYSFVVDGKPSLFNEKTKRQYLALRAIGQNLITTSADGRSLLWGDTKEAITNIPAGIKPTECLVEFLETEDGVLLLDRIIKSI